MRLARHALSLRFGRGCGRRKSGVKPFAQSVLGKPPHSKRRRPPRKAAATKLKALRMWVLGVPEGVVLEVAGGLDGGEVVAGAGYELQSYR